MAAPWEANPKRNLPNNLKLQIPSSKSMHISRETNNPIPKIPIAQITLKRCVHETANLLFVGLSHSNDGSLVKAQLDINPSPHMAFLQRRSIMPENSDTTPNVQAPSEPPTEEARPTFLSQITSPRSRKQLGLFFAGASFFAFSSLITRRALVRRYRASMPGFYQPSNRPKDVNGAIEAVEALSIASINVSSAALMLTGGALWAFDISSMDDARRKVRRGLGVDGTGRSEQDAEQEFEEWLATVLARKDDKEKRAKDGRGTPKDDGRDDTSSR